MKEARLKEASEEPGNMRERRLMDEWAARREVEVMYSPKWMGARVSCSAKEMMVERVARRTGEVRELPPKRAWSTVAATVEATPRVTEN
jgi:hypothetical protein